MQTAAVKETKKDSWPLEAASLRQERTTLLEENIQLSDQVWHLRDKQLVLLKCSAVISTRARICTSSRYIS
jgi:hypothetical protein